MSKANQELTFSGVIPANLLPFTPDYAIAEAEYRRHLTWLADVPGTTAITVNGHAAEELTPLSQELWQQRAGRSFGNRIRGVAER